MAKLLPTSLRIITLLLISGCVPSVSQVPTSSPVEISNITIYNDGGTYIIDDSVPFNDEVFVVTKDTTLIVKEGGVISAPIHSQWPAIRLSIGSTVNATGGTITGSKASDGGDSIQLNNGQSSTETASYAEFYDGIKVAGGEGTSGKGGDALVVNGFGTSAIIYGGKFLGGSGAISDGNSIRVFNSAVVHIHSGIFHGDITVEGNGLIVLYGCFVKYGTQVVGVFSDETELDVNVKSESDGAIDFVLVPEKECDTAPSVSPTSYPTLSPQPTVQTSGKNIVASSAVVLIVNIMSHFHAIATLF